MTLPKRPGGAASAFAFLILGLALASPARSADPPPGKNPDLSKPASDPGSLDLRARIGQFARELRERAWQIEDQWIQGERQFVDGLRKSMRETETRIAEEAGGRADWRKAKREAREKARQLERELRQKVKIRREELELQLIAFEKERGQQLQEFLEKLEADAAGFKEKAGAGYQRARADLSAAKAELKAELRNWRQRLKGLKTKERFWE